MKNYIDKSKPVLIARNLTKSYNMGEVEVHALRGVDLELTEGELLVILGPSGSGKSTLLNLIGGLDTPSGGSLTYDKKELVGASDKLLTRYRREHVGFVFQFYNLIPSLTAKENVALASEIAYSPMSAEDALELVDLKPRMDHFPSQLSGGEQQRVAIARAVAKRPKLLLCDEPTGALDATTGRVVLEVLSRVNKEMNTTVAIITHNAAIGDMAHRVITLGDGLIGNIKVNEHRVSADKVSW